MRPADDEAREEAAWGDFVRRLGEQLAAQWPAMPERLGERYSAFVEHAVQQAGKRGIERAGAVARYVNLCFVWGPAFHDKPGFEWALGLLAAPRQHHWSTVHQLVRRSAAELQRLPEVRISADALVAADERLLDVFGPLGRRGALHPPQPAPAPRHACDLEAVELRLLEAAVTQEYAWRAGEWQRIDLPAPASLRIDAAHAAPRLVGVLSLAPGSKPLAKLQLRSRSHALCDADVHPALDFAGTHGLWRWQGHETRAVSWPVSTLDQVLPPAGAGSAIAEETSPDIFKLELQVCGLRDVGDPLGTLSTQVWVWPASQWWLEVRRQPPPPPAAAGATTSGGPEGARLVTRCQLECDGQAQEAVPLRERFEQGLDGAVAQARRKLLDDWSAVPDLSRPQLEGGLALLAGRASFTWGWKLGAGGLDGRALMRLQAEIDMQACQSDLALEGELVFGGAACRVVLRCVGAAPLPSSLRRKTAEPALLPTLLPALVRFRLPFVAEIVPLAGDSGALLQAAAPCTGALVGEAGLRPRTSGGSGWEWFASLRVEAVGLALELVDPLLGRQLQLLPLLADQVLLDWKAA